MKYKGHDGVVVSDILIWVPVEYKVWNSLVVFDIMIWVLEEHI